MPANVYILIYFILGHGKKAARFQNLAILGSKLVLIMTLRVQVSESAVQMYVC